MTRINLNGFVGVEWSGEGRRGQERRREKGGGYIICICAKRD